MPPPASNEPVCRQCAGCGAVVAPDASVCWLCHEKLVKAIPAPAGVNPFAAKAQESWALHAGIWLAVVLCAVITFGLTFGSNKYYAIGFAVMVVPALAIVLGGIPLYYIINNRINRS